MSFSFEDTEAKIIALLLSSGEPFRRSALASLLDISVQDLDQKVNLLNETFKKINLPLEILRIDNNYEIVIASNYGSFVSNALQKTSWPKNLSQAALETLSIIAFRQPITRKEIMKIRGVAPDSSLATLLEIGFIAKIEKESKTYYVTTSEFLKACGLKSQSELKHLLGETEKE
jgi:segregation and condensation protein B